MDFWPVLSSCHPCIKSLTYPRFLCQYRLANEKVSHLKAKLFSEESAYTPIYDQQMILNKRELLDDETMMFLIVPIDGKATSKDAVNLISSSQFKGLLDTLVSNTGEQGAQQSEACASIAHCIQRNVVECRQHCSLTNQIPQLIMPLKKSNVKMPNEKWQVMLWYN